MAPTPFTLAKLKAECQANPTGLSDAASGETLAQAFALGGDDLCATMLNRIIAANPVRRIDIAPLEILGAIDDRDWVAPANIGQIQAEWFNALMRQGMIALQDANGLNNAVLHNLRSLVLNPGTQGSRAAIDALATRDGSRAEALWGTGLLITGLDISQARAA